MKGLLIIIRSIHNFLSLKFSISSTSKEYSLFPQKSSTNLMGDEVVLTPAVDPVLWQNCKIHD
uniref:Uncharacterized protein n=1 Tax=Anguilla anguilla TaxID=7936 RepID=A0A0E9S584_ANGAN